MQYKRNAQRCLDLLAALNTQHGWNLTHQMQQRYARQIVQICPDLPGLSDSELHRIATNYHTDHEMVEALHDSTHPEHSARWLEWTRQTLRWLIGRSTLLPGIDEAAISLDDLAQEAMYDLWRGLGSYCYRSRFQTWAFTVISNCLIRYRRAWQTQKRGTPSQSLEALIAAGRMFYDCTAPAPDEIALSRLLALLSRQILAQHPDRRLTKIFQLWAYEEQTLSMIGKQLNLSSTRVHCLLHEALLLLQSELRRQDWVELGSNRYNSGWAYSAGPKE